MMPTKSGYKTTEFWFTLVANLLGILSISGAFPEGSVYAEVLAAIVMALSNLGYGVSRGLAKRQGGIL